MCATHRFNMRFIKYIPDSDMAKYLQTKPIANHLANIIATRARRTDCKFTGLKVGQCYLGDVSKIGVTPKQYRTAKKLLEKIGFATFEGTNKGTTATLVSIEVYNINAEAEGEQGGEQQDNLEDTQGASKGRQTNNEKKEEELKELKNKEKSLVPLFVEIAEFYKSTTGQNIIIGKTDSLIMRSDKYKKISARLKDGATVEQCKSVIKLKNNEWKDDKKMQKNINIPTLFRASNFEKYLDAVNNSTEKIITKETKFPYEVPKFDTLDQRYMYFLARYTEYKQSGLLDEFKANTEYRQRAIYDKDAERLCFELELEQPELLKIEFNYKL